MAVCNMQRFLDIVLSLALLMVLCPILIAIMCALMLTGERKVFYVQQRIGRGCVEFGLLKFATMLQDSPNLVGGNITIKDDPRILPFGKFLRKSKLNELPQLFNVLRGDMSLIGPRPLTKDNFYMYSKFEREIISKLRPGLSGLGSIFFRNEENLLGGDVSRTEVYKNIIAPNKARLEVWFVKNNNIRIYFVLLFATLYVVLNGNHNHIRRLVSGIPKLDVNNWEK